jgi:hypothetical protein
VTAATREAGEHVHGTSLVAEAALVCASGDCPWSRSGKGRNRWLANRAAALRHVQATGHPVLASVVTTYTYTLVPDGK